MSLEVSPLNIFIPATVMPITLEGSIVRLEPIRREHAVIFWDLARNDADDIFQWIPYRMKSAEDFKQVVDKAFVEQQRGEWWYRNDRAQFREGGRQYALHEYRPHQSPG